MLSTTESRKRTPVYSKIIIIIIIITLKLHQSQEYGYLWPRITSGATEKSNKASHSKRTAYCRNFNCLVSNRRVESKIVPTPSSSRQAQDTTAMKRLGKHEDNDRSYLATVLLLPGENAAPPSPPINASKFL